MNRSIMWRISIMPMTIFPFFGGLLVAGLYFGVSAINELFFDGSPFPIAPKALVALSVMAANVVISFCIFRAVGWARSLVVIVPVAPYIFEFGTPNELSTSFQTVELLASFILIPLCSIYCLYMSQSGKDWFAQAWPYEL